jgi:hypothetical protein
MRFVNDINLTDVQFLSRGAGGGDEASAYDTDIGMGEAGPAGDAVDDLPF